MSTQSKSTSKYEAKEGLISKTYKLSCEVSEALQRLVIRRE